MSETPAGPDALPGKPTSPWLDDPPRTDSPDYDPLTESLAVDVAVVGGGIAGLSAAVHCRERGLSVVVLERDRLVSGVTGRTTAKVTSQHGLVYDHLRREFGSERARQYARVNEGAIEEIADRVDELGIAAECGFERRPHYVYGDDRDAMEREAAAAREAGLSASFVTSVPPFDRAECGVRFDDQACFHPRRYLLALADDLADRSGVELFEGTRVTDVEPGPSPTLATEVVEDQRGDGERSDGKRGDDEGAPRDRTGTDPDARGRVSAGTVVLATGFPILDRAGYFARMHPKRSYVLGLTLDGDLPEGMYYRPTGAGGEKYRSVRPHRSPDGELLLVGGENHKTGQGGSTADRYRRLARWARQRFPVRSIEYRWSTQDYVPADRVPMVGRLGARAENVLVATGFRGWGMTGGAAAGRLVAALANGESPPERELFDPLRFTPKASAPDALVENADAASQFATDWARALLSPDGEPVAPGEGRIVRRNGRPVAVTRDDSGERHEVSAVCPHMKCVVQWNDGEGSWDCPCHGSRFEADGTLLEGPATEALSAVDPPADGPESGADSSAHGREAGVGSPADGQEAGADSPTDGQEAGADSPTDGQEAGADSPTDGRGSADGPE